MKKSFIFSLLAIFLAGLGLGGVSLAAEDCQAKINDGDCLTLEVAIDSVSVGEIVTLLKDFTTNSFTVAADKNFILDLNGKTLTLNNSESYDKIYGSLVIRDTATTPGKIVVRDYGIMPRAGGILTVENGIFDTQTSSADYMFYLGGGTLHIIDGTFNGYYNVINCYADGDYALGGTVIIDSGTFVTTENDLYGNATIMGYQNSNITINGGVFTSVPVDEATLDDEYGILGVFIVGNADLTDPSSASNAVAAINGGNFNGLVVVEDSAELTIAGGMFSEDPSAYLAEGYSVVNNGGSYTVAGLVARIGDTHCDQDGAKCYISLQAAIDAAQGGDTVTVLTDLDQTEQVEITKSLTLDLNGKTLSNTKNIWDDNDAWSLISVQGASVELTITGNGKLQAKENDEYAVDLRDGSKVTIENGTFIGNIHTVYVYEGELTINGGTYSIQQLYGQGKDYEFTINLWDTNRSNGKAKAIIKGGTYYKFDPSNCKAEGEGTNFLAEGYQSTANGDYYTVSAIDYTITISDSISNGTVTASKTTANVGDEITLTATPTSNYNFGSWSVKDVDDNTITVTNNKFTMPAKNVTVTATFNKKSSPSSSSSSSSSTSSEEEGSGNNNVEENTTPTVDPQAVQANGYTNEMNEAYEFAYANGITTMKSIDEAEMFDGLTRIAMAKMLSQYAINVLGKSPADVEVPNFVDVTSDLDAEYDNGVTLAYKLGIMGINMPGNKFLPFEYVTRAQFGTALSRLLFGTEDGEDKYYTTHLAKLKEAGIITNDDPTLEELRGYVMLMLYRSANDTNAVNNTSEGVVSNENTNKPVNESSVQEQEVEKYFTEAYRRGQIYGRIGDLQRLLQSLGFYNGEINNTFDNNTIDAVFDFQIAMGILPADDTSASRGNVGPKTREILNQKWAEFQGK